jgi:outer membrane lipoprotein-sorting protein
MAGGSQAAVFGSLLAGLMVLAGPAGAEQVPLPPPAPQAKTGAAPGTAPVPPGSIPSAPVPPATVPAGKGESGKVESGKGESGKGESGKTESGLSSWLPSIFSGKPPTESKPSITLDPTQKALVDKVSAYLSNVQVMSGDFAQVAADGSQTKGHFYIQKPGKVRFEYEPPTPIEIVANGVDVVVRDRRLATNDLIPLSQTPLRYLLADKIDLVKDTNVVGVYADQLYATVVVEEHQAVIGTSRLMMMFDANSLQLRQWTVTDPQGYDTTIAVSNLDSSKRPDPSLFTIDYTRYMQ